MRRSSYVYAKEHRTKFTCPTERLLVRDAEGIEVMLAAPRNACSTRVLWCSPEGIDPITPPNARPMLLGGWMFASTLTFGT